MGWQPEEDDDWELPGDDVLRELSPLLATRKHGLFQRIERQRAAYFADVEDGQDDDEDVEGQDAGEGAESRRGAGNPDGKGYGMGGTRLSSLAFADLSTWCCDAFLGARSGLGPLAERSTWQISLVDRPTMILSRLASPSVPVADMPTVPILPAISAGAARSGLLLWPGGKAWTILARFCRRLLRVWFRCVRRMARLRQARRPALNGHELLMERLRERNQRGVSPGVLHTPPGERRTRQFRLPADSLFN